MTHGAEVPNAAGLAGGLPGATVVQRWAAQGAIDGVLRPDVAFEQLGPKPGLRPMRPGDVFAVSWQGGGGWGDPLSRDPDAVLHDLRRGAISAETASDVYGVALAAGAVDAAATISRRDAMRSARIGGRRRAPDRRPEARPVLSLGGALGLYDDDGVYRVITEAGAVLSQGDTRWRAAAISAPPPPSMLAHVRLHEGLAMTAFYCPVSGALLSVDVHEKGKMPEDDVVLDLAWITAG